MSASRSTALAYIEKWVEWHKDKVVPTFGLMGMHRPADDPPPGLWPVIQVETSFRSDAEWYAAYMLHAAKDRKSFRAVAADLKIPVSTLHGWHRRWEMRIARNIAKRAPETVVESEILRWRSGNPDPLLDLAKRIASWSFN